MWSLPATNTALIEKVKQGNATLADLTAGGAVQHGVSTRDYPCSDTGNDCTEVIFAVSVSGVLPSAQMTWFQAQQACLNAGKRLPTSAEWQGAALGTPDPGTDNGTTDCNINSATNASPEDPVATGSRTACVAARGAYDMVGNVSEWVADWDEHCPTHSNFSAAFGNDITCIGGDGSQGHDPVALFRGGDFTLGVQAGVFALRSEAPGHNFNNLGFRCARPR